MKEGGYQMIVLHIEHSVHSFDSWKAAFDSDPVGRQKSGVRCYRISRSIDDSGLVTIDLEFNRAGEAQALLAAMQQVWQRVTGTLIQSPQWHISEVVETKAY
jgi:hypothetical protein